ncbi:conserved Plasmodium protein, unknown function [Plasmodium yoelii]|uniref:Dynein regulatory complex protein 10 n=4 Tax=Plasmodium yoelii TaxID=5861 RepID=A0AAF0B4S7_PLAYO|nr:conserved Plasmodium protein, unknown function [Plasmodium yoelii]WBY57554.1 hypothetical protein Py17XNL_000900412 [Plasmodium yoelii yoelii]VTZ78588.1 conserved Plasmodium protein, unknown function [Plasmodium yoelii]|eukprot:XP_022812269.1 conserved Plasmodium protein, unknown function [Plasmodium yoelii]
MINPDKFIGTEAHNLYNVIEIFEKKIKNLSLINEEVLEKINEVDLNITSEEFLRYFKNIIQLNKLYEHTDLSKGKEKEKEKENQNQNQNQNQDENQDGSGGDSDSDSDSDSSEGEQISNYKENKELIEKIKKYSSTLCKIFKGNNNLVKVLKPLNDKENHDFFKFRHIIKDLKGTFLLKFQTTAKEKYDRLNILEELKKEEDNMRDEEKRLNHELETIRNKSYNDIKNLESILINKEDEIQKLKKMSDEKIKELLNTLPVNNIPEELETINTIFEKTKNLYENQIKTYQDLEVSLVKKNNLLELDIQNYIDSLDSEIRKIDAEIGYYHTELQKSKVQEDELDGIIKRKEIEQDENNYLKDLAEKRDKIIKKKEDKHNYAAIVIQSYIRAVKERNLFGKHEKKKKKKIKKKKKK